MDRIQLEKYLNKEVRIEEKMYEYPSTMKHKMSTGIAGINAIEGILTNFDESFIEIDNSQLISRNYIYRIMLK